MGSATDIVNKHCAKAAEAAKEALNPLINEFRKKKLLHQLDDDFKDHLLRQIGISVNAAYEKFKIDVKKNLEYSSSTEHRTKSETSASTVDSGCPSTSRSYSSQATIGSSFSRGAFSSHTVIDLTGSSGVNETELQSEDQNESDTLIDAVSHNATHLAGVMSSNLDGNIDVPEAEPKEETGQSSKKPTNKRKHESDGESSNKKAKTVDYKCERCDRSFSNETQLTRHMASRHWPCEVCCKEFETVQKRDEHKKTHKLEK